MRIMDWSADVCSSDLLFGAGHLFPLGRPYGGDRISRWRRAEVENSPSRACHRPRRRQELNPAGSWGRPPTIACRSRRHIHPVSHRSEEHTSELQSLMRISYAVFCLKKKKHTTTHEDEPQ